MRKTPSRRAHQVDLVAGILGGGAFVVTAMLATRSGSYDVWVSVIVAPLLFLVTLPALIRQASRENDKRLLWFLVVALLAKLLATLVRYYITFEVYSRADASDYHERGIGLAERFRSGNFDLSGLKGAIVSTNFIRVFTGIVYTFTGPSKLAGFLVFSWLGFIGLFYFYRAFVVAAPNGDHRWYGRLVFFLPTLLYWPSSIGKESWMMFGLGVAAFGASRLLSGSTLKGASTLVVGFWLMSLVRPHMTGLMGIALAGAYVLRKVKSSYGELAPVIKGVTLAALTVVAVALVSQADQFLDDKGLDTSGGYESVVDETEERTAAGGSEFEPSSVFDSPLNLPAATVTVLFRPLPIEANNLQALAATVESTFILGFFLVRWRWFVAGIKAMRRHPYVLFAVIYTGLFIVAFSGIANFGLLVRQRAQLLPILLVLVCVIRPQRPSDSGKEDPDELSAAQDGKDGRVHDRFAPAPTTR